MSYELDYRDEKPCPCGKGKVVTECYSNEWNQRKSHTFLQCAECMANLHVETLCYYRNGMSESNPVLVPNGETLGSLMPSINIFSTPIAEQFCYKFSFSDLESMYAELIAVTACSKLTNDKTRKAVRMCRDTCKSGKISVVRDKVKEALDIYPSLEWNYDNEAKRVAEVRKHILWL